MPDDEPNANNSTATTPAATATQPAAAQPAPTQPRMYSESEAEAMAVQRANSAAAAARREADGKKANPPAAPRSEPAAVTIEDLQRTMAQQLRFEAGLARIAEKNQWTAEVESKVRTLYGAENPPDVGAWLTSTAKLFGGLPVSTQPPAATNQNAASTTPNVPAPMAPSAPSTTVPLERDVDIFSMDPSAVHELMRKSGATDPSRPYDPKNRAGSRAVRILVEDALRTRRVKLGSK